MGRHMHLLGKAKDAQIGASRQHEPQDDVQIGRVTVGATDLAHVAQRFNSTAECVTHEPKSELLRQRQELRNLSGHHIWHGDPLAGADHQGRKNWAKEEQVGQSRVT